MGACNDDSSATSLYPDGPPQVLQVRMLEDVANASGVFTTDRVFGFGNTPSGGPADQHPVTSAFAGTTGGISPGKTGRQLRVVMSELLEGNHLEEIQCRAIVDDDDYEPVPDGATPDDIARCSTAQDVLSSTCTGDRAVCICHNAAGCVVGADTIAEGDPVGVEDQNQDGAADNTQLIAGSVGIRCQADSGPVDVPMDPDMSYWNPSGNQQVPADGPDKFDALGPAIVLLPSAAMPTSATCGLTFADDVVDKAGLRVCATPGGAPADGSRAAGCNEGDVSAFTFKTEALRLQATPGEGAMNVSRTTDFLITPIAPVDMASAVTAISVLEGATPYTQFTVSTDALGQVHLVWTAVGGLTAMTMYTVTVSTALTDAYGQPLKTAFTRTFTTGP
jgi:hypothetical protein